MRVNYRDNNLIVFLNKNEISDVDFFDKLKMESYFRDLFSRLNNYGYDFCGNYNISVFIDDFYGVVLEICKGEQDFYECYDFIDMDINVSKYRNFLYKLDYFIDGLDGKYYSYNGSIFFEPGKVNFYDLGILIENGELIYGVQCMDIKKMGDVLLCT